MSKHTFDVLEEISREVKPEDLIPLPPLYGDEDREYSQTWLDAELERRRMYGRRRSWREDEV